jgi:hypothetical protein
MEKAEIPNVGPKHQLSQNKESSQNKQVRGRSLQQGARPEGEGRDPKKKNHRLFFIIYFWKDGKRPCIHYAFPSIPPQQYHPT